MERTDRERARLLGETGRGCAAADAWRADERSWREAEAMPGEAGTLADEIALTIARAREAGDETVHARKSKRRTTVRNRRETDYPAWPIA